MACTRRQCVCSVEWQHRIQPDATPSDQQWALHLDHFLLDLDLIVHFLLDLNLVVDFQSDCNTNNPSYISTHLATNEVSESDTINVTHCEAINRSNCSS